MLSILASSIPVQYSCGKTAHAVVASTVTCGSERDTIGAWFNGSPLWARPDLRLAGKSRARRLKSVSKAWEAGNRHAHTGNKQIKRIGLTIPNDVSGHHDGCSITIRSENNPSDIQNGVRK
jgi:hypothetical protein